jgi:cell division protease FtsH
MNGLNGLFKQVSLWIVLAIIVVLVLTRFSEMNTQPSLKGQADFLAQLEAGNIKSPVKVTLGEKSDRVYVEFKDAVGDTKQKELAPFTVPEFRKEWEETLRAQGVSVDYGEENSMIPNMIFQIFLLLLIIGAFWFFMIRQMQGGNNKAMSFGKSRARMVNQGDKTVTFNDVAGVDEAKEELHEIIEFLKEPKKFTRLGGKIPRGVLLVGPPGSGKTLLARAVAGEASVPFFSISGSDFVEMFVGVGASRVRDLFQQGHKHAPCIIFIDEIDAVGRQRGAGLGGGHDEREQTLNQLLVEMDGFNTNDGVILMAATNRPDVLDRALLRPGRFDRQVVVANPDIKGRQQILDIHIKNQKVPLDADVDSSILARSTPGFSGADLANMVNEAALLAARRSQDKVTMIDFEDAKDRVMMGPARNSLVMSQDQKLATAYHEAGHALLCQLLPDADPMHKVTVIPRGPALGVTSSLPTEDKYCASKKWCLANMRMIMGGRAAEDIIYGEFNSGAANDLKVATARAHAMVCEWGMSDLGPICFSSNDEVFLGRDFSKTRDYSDETAAAVDREVHRLLEEAYADAKKILEEHTDILKALAEELFERETLDAREVNAIIRRVGGENLIPPDPAPRTAETEKQTATGGVIPESKDGRSRNDDSPEAVPPGGIVPDTV